MSTLGRVIDRERRSQAIQADRCDARRLEALVFPFARSARRSARGKNGHLAVYFPLWWTCWRRQCDMAYDRFR